jgi:hypothetical protein
VKPAIFSLSSAELRIATMIKNGLTSMDISLLKDSSEAHPKEAEPSAG